MSFKFFAVLILVVSITAEPLRFDNYKVYTIKVQNDDQLVALQSLSTGPHQYEFIDEPNGEKVDLIVPPHLQDNFELLVSEKRMNVELAIPNLQHLIDRESPKKSVAASVEDFSWDQYYGIDIIHEWLYSMAEQYEEVTIINIGKSFEGRDILGVNINRNPAGNSGIFMEFNIHAREWITSATATYIIHQLLTATENEPEMKELADNYNWYFIPVVNVDGYEYSREFYRLWRKTRSRQGYICTGVDPNRNFNVFWEQGGIGSADNMCEIMYAGPEAFSEVETRALSEYILSIREHLNLYIACHSAAQMLLMPWGHSPEQIPEYTDFMSIIEAAVTALTARYGTQYTYGPIYSTIYPASGSSADWVYYTLGIPSFTYEFRGENTETGEKYSYVAPPGSNSTKCYRNCGFIESINKTHKGIGILVEMQ